MKSFLLRLQMLAILVNCAYVCFSQHSGGNQGNPSKSINATSESISELNQLLQTASSPRKKADILYELANACLGNFKVDSSLYYSQEIRKIAIPDQYALGIGKYHLANAGAYFLRNKALEVSNHLDSACRLHLKVIGMKNKNRSFVLRIIISFNHLKLIAFELSLPVITDIHGHLHIFRGLTKQPNL